VAVPDTYRNSSIAGYFQQNATKMLYMAMDTSKWTMLTQGISECRRITPDTNLAWHRMREYSPTKSKDLVVEMAFLESVDRKVKLNLIAVNGAVNIHDERLCTTSVHPAKHM
jgi:hypothetical protein